MDMDVVWHEGLSVGVVEIDNQHKELIKRKHYLDEALAHGRGAEELEKLCRFLEFYIVAHFQLEEFYMTQYGFPGYEEHRSVHRDFIERFLANRAAIEKQGKTDEVVRQVGNFIADWLSKHILHEDQEFGAFLKSRLGGNAEDGGTSVNVSLVGYDKVYRAGGPADDSELMKFVDGILEEGKHEIGLSRGEQTAWLKIPAGKRGSVRKNAGEGKYTVLIEEGSIMQNSGGRDFDIPASPFRIIAEEDQQQFTITIASPHS